MSEDRRFYLNVLLGRNDDDHHMKEWYRVRAAQEGVSMAAYAKRVLRKHMEEAHR